MFSTATMNIRYFRLIVIVLGRFIISTRIKVNQLDKSTSRPMIHNFYIRSLMKVLLDSVGLLKLTSGTKQ